MSNQMPEGWRVYQIEFVRRATVEVWAKSREDTERAAEHEIYSGRVRDYMSEWRVEDVWRCDGGDAEHAVHDGKVVELDELRAAGVLPYTAPEIVPDAWRAAVEEHRLGAARHLVIMRSGERRILTDGSHALVMDGAPQPTDKALAHVEVFDGNWTPVVLGARLKDDGGWLVGVGDSWLRAPFVDLVAELWPDAVWGEGPLAFVAKVGDRPVAAAMPVSR